MTRIAAVVDLFLRGCPAAIRRFIVAVSIDAVKSQPIRALAHIRKEVQKASTLRLAPAGTDGNSSASVILPADIGGRRATANHGAPRTPSRRVLPAMLDRVIQCAMLVPAAIMHRAPTSFHSGFGAIRDATGRAHFSPPFIPGFTTKRTPRLPDGQRMPVGVPSLIVHLAPRTRIEGPIAAFDGTSGTLAAHREASLPGVTGRAVSAAPSLYFTTAGGV